MPEFPRLFEPAETLPPAPGAALDWRAGDLLLFYGSDPVSRMIELATWGPSHIGIIARLGHLHYLVESTTLCNLPDAIDGTYREGVQVHSPELRIGVYPGRVERMRLVPGWRFDEYETLTLERWINHLRGTPYDLLGAVISGTRLFKWTHLAPYADERSVFCSELCAGALMRLGRMPVRNPAAYNPASLARALRRSGVYETPEAIDWPGSQREAA